MLSIVIQQLNSCLEDLDPPELISMMQISVVFALHIVWHQWSFVDLDLCSHLVPPMASSTR
jgi:hypothetical protein